jgi:predicted dehydrogenase
MNNESGLSNQDRIPSIPRKFRVGVVGVRRGESFLKLFAHHPWSQLVAVCDRSASRIQHSQSAAGKEWNEGVTFYDNYEKFLEHDLDIIVLANDAHEHAILSIPALKSGRHVLSEVPACQTMGEAVELVEAVENSDRVFMISEQNGFRPYQTEMKRLYDSGAIGKLQHSEAEYIHGTDHMWARLTSGNTQHWRNWRPSTFYCTHSLGVVLYMTGTRVAQVVGMESPNRIGHLHGRRAGDSGTLMCQLSDGSTLKSIQSHGGLQRPNLSRHWYVLYGTEGTIEVDRFENGRIHLFREKEAPQNRLVSYTPENGADLGTFSDIARKFTGHGGGDFYTVHYFLQTILGQMENPIDVYRSIDMSIPGLLGFRSIMEGNKRYEVPDLRDKAARDKWRGDHWCVDPKYAGPGQPTSSSAFAVPPIPKEVYEKQRQEAEASEYPPVEHM